jgi:formate dehydrogenase major subunit
VVQDIFLTETAWHADVVLPASVFPEKTGTFTNTDRRVQLGRTALPLPGQARLDLDILIDLANRLGCGWTYKDVGEVYTEMADTMPSLKNISWQRLVNEGAVTYPADGPNVPGNEILFSAGYPTKSGRGKIVPAAVRPPDEIPDDQYPFVLSTGRVLEHWHTGAMTRRSAVLDELEPEAMAFLAPRDVERLGLKRGDMIRVTTRRGAIEIKVRVDSDVPNGMVFIPFCYAEAAANLLTNPALDPFGKIPEFKFCAAQVEPLKALAEAAE